MMSASKRLAAVGGEPVSQGVVDHSRIVEKFGTQVADQLGPLLQMKNGFYAFEAALHVLSDVGATDEKGLFEWNDEALWRQDYTGMANDAVFFAEDVFGMQFCIREGTVATFDPETGAFETMAADVEEWADKVLREYDVWAGYNVAHEWQVKHGPIPVGSRLVPGTPFALGGEYSGRNLHVIEAVKGMKYRASIAVQIRDLPDGTPITIRVIEDEERDRDPARE